MAKPAPFYDSNATAEQFAQAMMAAVGADMSRIPHAYHGQVFETILSGCVRLALEYLPKEKVAAILRQLADDSEGK